MKKVEPDICKEEETDEETDGEKVLHNRMSHTYVGTGTVDVVAASQDDDILHHPEKRVRNVRAFQGDVTARNAGREESAQSTLASGLSLV